MSRLAGSTRRGLPAAAAGIAAPSDRRFRRSDVRLGRRRSWQAGVVRVLAFGAAGLIGLALVVWVGRAVVHAEVFKIAHVTVQGNARLSAGDVRSLVEGISGESIFRVDLERYRLRLLDSPWVANAALWRVFPSTVEVRIAERTPLAIARLDGQLYLVDASGVIIDSLGPQYREYDLPIVDGLLTGSQGRTVADPRRIQLTERLLSELAGRQDLLRRLSQVDVTDPRNAVVLLDDEPARLFLGDQQFLERLQRYEQTVAAAREQVPAIDYFELRHERVFVGPVGGSAAQVGGSRTAK